MPVRSSIGDPPVSIGGSWGGGVVTSFSGLFGLRVGRSGVVSTSLPPYVLSSVELFLEEIILLKFLVVSRERFFTDIGLAMQRALRDGIS